MNAKIASAASTVEYIFSFNKSRDKNWMTKPGSDEEPSSSRQLSYRRVIDTAWSKIRYNGIKLRNHKISKRSAIWLLGQFYEVNRDELIGMDCYHNFENDLQSRIWLTYRTGFAPFPNTLCTTDSGWGCTIRSCQMMLAQAFVLLNLGRGWRFSANYIDHRHIKIVSLFTDSDGSELGIHKLMEYATKYSAEAIGSWYTPSFALSLLRRALSSVCASTHIVPLTMYNVIDGLLIKEEIARTSCDFSLPILITVSMRIGATGVNSCYFDSVMDLFSLPNVVGIVGGRPKYSMYFVGCYNRKKIIYLDPHTANKALLPSSLGESWQTFHCKQAGVICIEEIDPSCSLGFLIRSEAEYDETIRKLDEIHVIDMPSQVVMGRFNPLFTALQEREGVCEADLHSLNDSFSV